MLNGKKFLSHYFCEMDAALLEGFWKWSPTSKSLPWAMFGVLLLTLTSLSQLSVPLLSGLLDLPSLCHPYSVLPHISVCPVLVCSFFILNLDICISLLAFLSVNFLQENPFFREWQNVHTVIQKWDPCSCRHIPTNQYLYHLTKLLIAQKGIIIWELVMISVVGLDMFVQCKLLELAFNATLIASLGGKPWKICDLGMKH